ncbi:MAG TPA: universal stress protein, partial [Thermodesulfobacteriota bacterium]|nr:universal stress protein [Thermodesulfobacteriota bacterium]
PPGLILQKTAETNADMVIMGSHRKSWLAHAFLGSVAESVLQRTRIPVYLIPLPEGEDAVSTHPSPRRIPRHL